MRPILGHRHSGWRAALFTAWLLADGPAQCNPQKTGCECDDGVGSAYGAVRCTASSMDVHCAPPAAVAIIATRPRRAPQCPFDTMNLALDSSTITHSIQLAVAPVFLLTAVAGMIGAVAGRLARIIDRARVVEERARHTDESDFLQRAMLELGYLRTRGRMANGCIGLLTLCGFLIGVTIILLFLGETTNFRGHTWALGSFLSGVLSFLLALVLFFVETVMATRILNFHMLRAPAPAPAPAPTPTPATPQP